MWLSPLSFLELVHVKLLLEYCCQATDTVPVKIHGFWPTSFSKKMNPDTRNKVWRSEIFWFETIFIQADFKCKCLWKAYSMKNNIKHFMLYIFSKGFHLLKILHFRSVQNRRFVQMTPWVSSPLYPFTPLLQPGFRCLLGRCMNPLCLCCITYCIYFQPL